MLLRNLATALLEHGKIKTTAGQGQGSPAVHREADHPGQGRLEPEQFPPRPGLLTSKEVAFKLFHEIGPRFKDRPGGYTRIYKLAKVRQGDAAISKAATGPAASSN